jgi:hypothetical protein
MLSVIFFYLIPFQLTSRSVGSRNLLKISKDICQIGSIEQIMPLPFIFDQKSMEEQIRSNEFINAFSSITMMLKNSKNLTLLSLIDVRIADCSSVELISPFKSILLVCATCGYTNMLPFELARRIFKKDKMEEIERAAGQLVVNVDELAWKQAYNFSLVWIKEAECVKIKQKVPQYVCPRCQLNKSEKFLQYIYRFWISLKDDHGGFLKNCLVEGEEALLLVNSIDPYLLLKSKQTEQKIVEALNEKIKNGRFFITIKKFIVPNSILISNSQDESDELDDDDTPEPGVFHKVVQILEY